MEQNNIKNLLDKYFDGNTTIDEENQLKSYFSTENVADDLKQYQPIFQYFSTQEKVNFEPNINLKSNKKPIYYLSIAASIVLLIGLGTYFKNNNNTSSNNDLGSYNSPEVAFKETQKALQMLSSNVNIGINSVAYFNEYQETKNIIFVN